jgi:hypothetical protein
VSVTRVIRYRTRPERAEENVRLIEAVFAELATDNPEGLHYTAFRLDDGVSFVHVVTIDGDRNPLTASPAFAEFQAGIEDRCSEGPTPAEATVIGAY